VYLVLLVFVGDSGDSANPQLIRVKFGLPFLHFRTCNLKYPIGSSRLPATSKFVDSLPVGGR
jgi:hypothetical protein